MKDVIDFNDSNRDKEMPYFGQDIFIKAEAKGPLTSKEYTDALEANHRLSRKEGIDAVMDQFHLDAIMAPTAGPAWLTDLANGDHAVGGSSNAAAVAGYPDITVPAGFVFGLPVGISFFRPGLERTDAAENRIRIRADDPSTKAAAISADVKAMRRNSRGRKLLSATFDVELVKSG